jgi:hypothetical protein
MVSKTRQHKLEDCDLLPLITSSSKRNPREKMRERERATYEAIMNGNVMNNKACYSSHVP